MSKFIEVSIALDGRPVLVNLNSVSFICDSYEHIDKTTISFCDNSKLTVIENLEKIIELIKE